MIPFCFKALCVDADTKRERGVRDMVADVAVRRNIDIELTCLRDPHDIRIAREAVGAQVAFVALTDTNTSCRIGTIIEQAEPSCYILFYDGQETVLLDLLKARPYAWCAAQKTELKTTIERVMMHAYENSQLFRVRTRKKAWLIPLNSIVCVESRLHRLTLHTKTNMEISYIGKLEDAQTQLPSWLFLRVHQSYLVNLRAIRCVDTIKHTVTMMNELDAPVSQKYYAQLLQAIGIAVNSSKGVIMMRDFEYTEEQVEDQSSREISEASKMRKYEELENPELALSDIKSLDELRRQAAEARAHGDIDASNQLHIRISELEDAESGVDFDRAGDSVHKYAGKSIAVRNRENELASAIRSGSKNAIEIAKNHLAKAQAEEIAKKV